MTSSSVDLDLAREHGLTDREYDQILAILGRTPSFPELGIFSVMWSEHCSYKSSKRYLKQLPSRAEHVLCGPGENAGVVAIGDGLAIAFKIESHNHPSFIEPRQGAATGVGGILRDIFTMGARPIASLNSLRFGPLEDPKFTPVPRSIVASVARGLISNALRPATAMLGMVGIGSSGPQVDPCAEPLVDAGARPPSWIESDELRPFVADPPSRQGAESPQKPAD